MAKPPHLATILGRAEKDSVLHMLSRQIGLPSAGSDDPRLRLVHRLDKDTSGVLLFAKDIATQRHLSAQFQNNQVRKEYLALVAGRTPGDQGEIDAPIAPHPTQRDRMTVSKHGRSARTDWRLEKSMRRFALLRCFPKTGRTHQIRVHLKSIGLPLAVDSLYNPQPPDRLVGIFLSQFKHDYHPTLGEEERPLIARLSLHAEKITFTHVDGNELTIECPAPKDLRAAVAQLSKL